MQRIAHRLVARKPLSEIARDSEESGYKRTLGVWDLLSIGVGGIIGAGIFVLTGKAAAQNAGPGVVISYVIAGTISTLASLCYAELASSLPVSGSAYSFSYATLGELLAWVIGWDLMLEYLVGGATVAVGWSAYLGILQDVINKLTGGSWVFDSQFVNAPFIWLEQGDKIPWNHNLTTDAAGFWMNQVQNSAGNLVTPIINLPALLIVVACTSILMVGIKESVNVNNLMVIIKLLVVLLVIFSGIAFIHPENYVPFIPENEGKGKFGLSGVFEASVSVFFAYIGFDSVTTVAQESKNPQKDLPIGIIGSLMVCTVLYISVSAVITGMVKYTDIDLAAPVGAAFSTVGLPLLALIIDIGAIAGLTSVLLNLMIGQPRIFQSMANDGLFPSAFSRIHPKTGTPYVATLTSGITCAVLASLLPVDLLGNLTSVGTLFAFFLVSISVIVLRITDPDLPRQFKIPGPTWFGGFFLPGLSAVSSLLLFAQATTASILRVMIWMAIGLVVYAFYGYHHSRVGITIRQVENIPLDTIANKKEAEIPGQAADASHRTHFQDVV